MEHFVVAWGEESADTHCECKCAAQTFLLEPNITVMVTIRIVRGPPVAHPRTLVANQGSRAHYRKAPRTRGCMNTTMVIRQVWVPSYSHSPSGSTRLGTARKGGPTLHKRVARDKPSLKRVYQESMQREAARKSGAIGAPFQTKARRSVKGADRPSGHKRATSMALGPCAANAASMALGPTHGPRPETAQRGPQ